MAKKKKPRKSLTRKERSYRIAENAFKEHVKFWAQRLSREDMLAIINQHFEELLIEHVMSR